MILHDDGWTGSTATERNDNLGEKHDARSRKLDFFALWTFVCVWMERGTALFLHRGFCPLGVLYPRYQPTYTGLFFDEETHGWFVFMTSILSLHISPLFDTRIARRGNMQAEHEHTRLRIAEMAACGLERLAS
ncbi:hypothetical protein ACRALDRAFT_2031188 [Sodiomyces alcalophilus JCM 7366]|uniref:uncharacterized protein n=1 Tax=Sodiomyces alcalophilus JCM 7366 TaxID=591952 RepID=UPI0039B4EE79